MQFLRTYRIPASPARLDEHTRRYRYALVVTGVWAAFRLDQPGANPPWQGGGVPDGVLLGPDGDGHPVALFVEMKSMADGDRQAEHGQVAKARLQLLSGVFHFMPLGRCWGASGPLSHGDEHHARGDVDLGAALSRQMQNHRVAAVIVVFRVNLRRSVMPPPRAERRSLRLGGLPLCPRKPIALGIRVVALPPNAALRLAFADLLPR